MSDYAKGIAYTVAAALVWSTGGLLIKLITLDAFTILFYRSLYAGIFFIILFRGDAIKIDRRALITSICYAPLLIGFVLATKLTTAANAIFLQYVSPAIVLILEPRILKTKMLGYNIVTVIVCLLGLSFFLFEQKEQNNWFGDGLALLSGIFSACLILSLKASTPVQQKSGITLGNLWVVLITLPFFLKSPSPSMNEHFMLAFLGFVQIGFGYFLFTTGQRYISAIESSLITMLEPILNPIWVMIGYNEIPSTWSVIGGGIIITALIARMLYLRGSFKEIKSNIDV